MEHFLVDMNRNSFLAAKNQRKESSLVNAQENDVSFIVKNFLSSLDNESLLVAINELKKILALYSPYVSHPVDSVMWVHRNLIEANDYNPNKMAPVEQNLLKRSLLQSGFTQPLVVRKSGDRYIIIDGFHRFLISKDLFTYLPIVLVSGEDKAEVIAATVRHNRARGEHQVSAMSKLINDLVALDLTEEQISNELGMDRDEVLRLKQISGISSIFSDNTFSASWTVI